MKKLLSKIINTLKRGVWINLDIIENDFKNLKKLLLLALVAIMMAGCCNTQKEKTECDKTFKERWHGFHVEVIDSCEYILRYTERVAGHQGFGQSFMAHKGNCRYCAERRKQELKELVEQLKRNRHD